MTFSVSIGHVISGKDKGKVMKSSSGTHAYSADEYLASRRVLQPETATYRRFWPGTRFLRYPSPELGLCEHLLAHHLISSKLAYSEARIGEARRS